MSEFTPALHSSNVKTKGATYFFDVKTAKNGNNYLIITESRIKQGQKTRNSIFVFRDHIQEFSQVVGDMTQKVIA